MPMVLAASTMSVPAGTVTLVPSMVRLMSGTYGRRFYVALMPQGVVFVLVAEMPEGGVDHPTRGVAKPAEAASVLQTVGDAEKRVDLDLRSLVGEDPFVRAHCPVAADPAR